MAIYNGAEDARLLISPFELAVRLDRLNVVKEILRATSSETASSSSSSSAPTVSRSIMFSEEILGLAIKSHSMSVLKFLVCNHLDAYAEQQRDYIKSTIYSAIGKYI